MKIKIKKEMNLPQLIEWAWDNGIDSKTYTSSRGADISFDEYGDIVDVYRIDPNDVFIVEVEEKITKDTLIPEMLVIGRYDGYEEVSNQKLNDYNHNLLAAYLIDDDGMMTLIYDEHKGLVE